MFNEARLHGLIRHIAGHPGVKELGLTKLWKLLYFIDVKALRELGQTLTGSDYIKYEHGPVPSKGEKALKTLARENHLAINEATSGPHKIYKVIALGASGATAFTNEERGVIESVIELHGKATAKRLSELSHLEPAWSLAAHMHKMDPELMFYGAAEDPDGL